MTVNQNESKWWTKIMCREDNNKNLWQVDGRRLLKWRTKKVRTGIYVKLGIYAKVRNLCHR